MITTPSLAAARMMHERGLLWEGKEEEERGGGGVCRLMHECALARAATLALPPATAIRYQM
jgi:hypothetical protein